MYVHKWQRPTSSALFVTCARIFKQSMGARNRVGIGLSSLPARQHTLGWLNWFRGIDFWAPARFKNLCISYMNSFRLWGSCPLANKGCCQDMFSPSFNIINRGLQGDVVYLSWPIAPLVYEPKCGGGGCRTSANENSCAHHVTWSPNKLWRSNSLFNLFYKLSLIYCWERTISLRFLGI